jgi:hypothetical protein
MVKLPSGVEDWIDRFAHDKAAEIFGELYADAIKFVARGDSDLLRLLSIGRAAELKKFCKRAAVGKSEFSNLVIACEAGLLPWRHKISHRNFVPEHLNPTEEELSAIGTVAVGSPVPKAFQKGIIYLTPLGLSPGYPRGHRR